MLRELANFVLFILYLNAWTLALTYAFIGLCFILQTLAGDALKEI